ncbi:MAG TPA: IS1380 family transposase [Candidatus Udaeobacter sp.]|jgi:hypothetical protein
MDKIVMCSSGLPWRFTSKRVTAWGGLRLIEEMLRRIKFGAALAQAGLPQPGSNRGVDPVVVVHGFLVSVWIGAVRFAHTAALRFDPALRALFGLEAVPSVSTFTRFFRRFGQKQVDAVFGHMGRWFWGQVAPQLLTLDLDSTVVTRYGQHQEGAEIGYNPRRRGKPSHHPLLAFAAEVRMVVSAWLRPGKTQAACNVEAFLNEVLALLQPRHRIGLVRGDCGFCTSGMLAQLERNALNYIVVGRMLPTVRRLVSAINNWVELGEGLAVAECQYQMSNWSQPRRLVVVRHRLMERAGGALLLEVPAYGYSLYLTNLTLPALEVWRLYRGRADSENRIKELLYDFGLRGFASQSFWATEAAFRAVLLAYNLMALFRQLVLGTAARHTMSTLRFQCFAIGASLGREGRRQVLRLGLSPPKRPWFEGLFAAAQQIVPPWLTPSPQT